MVEDLKELVQRYITLLDAMRSLTEAHEEQMLKMRRESEAVLAAIRGASGLTTPDVNDLLHRFRDDPNIPKGGGLRP